ncbi:hypothetical protein, partial [Micromonospora sp. DT227]|uniref:hypothetical protein n=1 Tax=Micromonospora sp. DT227 TaxID=3393433 RepID=UPI003CF5D3DF
PTIHTPHRHTPHHRPEPLTLKRIGRQSNRLGRAGTRAEQCRPVHRSAMYVDTGERGQQCLRLIPVDSQRG